MTTNIKIPTYRSTLDGLLTVPEGASALVLFVHGSGSSRHSPRNQALARALNDAGLATLLFDLLTPEEETVDRFTANYRFDIRLLSKRLLDVTNWVKSQGIDAATDWAMSGGFGDNFGDNIGGISEMPIGYFASCTGAAAALVVAAERPQDVCAVVCRGGRPDLAGAALARVQAPTLLIVGGYDHSVIALNEAASKRLSCEVELKVVPGATHLFEEPGALEQVAKLAADWFVDKLEIDPEIVIHRRRGAAG